MIILLSFVAGALRPDRTEGGLREARPRLRSARSTGGPAPLARSDAFAFWLCFWFSSRGSCLVASDIGSAHLIARSFQTGLLAVRKTKGRGGWARGLVSLGAAGVRPARGPLSSSSQSAWADLGEVEEREESVPARRGAHSVSESLPSEVATVKHFLGACHGAACGTGGSDGRGSSRAAGRTQSRSPGRRWCRRTSARPREPRNRTRSTCPGSARASRRWRRARRASG